MVKSELEVEMVKQVSERGLNWFQDARFGMFIHWGLYALIGRGEWVMHHESIPVTEYEALVEDFNPVNFDADAWVELASEAGQKYIVITSRHHDGFSMYDTGLSSYKVTNSPFKRDPIEELAAACDRNGEVKLGFYVSLLDWHHPAYRFRQESGLAWSDYLGFLHGQVREVCTRFGELACIWFDGDWPDAELDEDNAYFEAGGPFEYQRLYDIVHTLQPHAVVHNNRHAEPLPGEDVQGFEQDLPGENTAGFNTREIYPLPLETCLTINDNWGYHAEDLNHKSTKHLVHLLARTASVGSNLLLNVGPTLLGEIQPEQQGRLREMGAWLKDHGESVYRTRAGAIPQDPGYVCTRKGDTHYIHVLDYVSDCVVVQGVPDGVIDTSLVCDGTQVKSERRNGEVVLILPPDQRDSFDTVVALVVEDY
jgi:alpha-L-fucosidase